MPRFMNASVSNCTARLVHELCIVLYGLKTVVKLCSASNYLNRIPIRAYSMAYLTGRIATCIEITHFRDKN